MVTIIKCISSLDMPPDNITDFLVGLIEEGNYFPPHFLWRCEVEALEFNRWILDLEFLLFNYHDYNRG